LDAVPREMGTVPQEMDAVQAYRDARIAELNARGLHLGDRVRCTLTHWLTGEPNDVIEGRLVIHRRVPQVRLDGWLRVNGRERRYVAASERWVKAG